MIPSAATIVLGNILAFVLGTVLCLLLLRRWRETPTRWMEVQELNKILTERHLVYVLDVRGEDEFNGPLGHIRGALNTPINELSGRLNELADLGGARLVAVCRTDKRSASAARLLSDAGIDAEVLRGGMEAWSRALLEVEKRPTAGERQRP